LIYSGESAIEYLGSQVSKEDIGESSHWRRYHSQFQYTGDGFMGLQGFGGHSRSYTGIRKFIHHMFQRHYRNMGTEFPYFNEIDDSASEITSKQGRAYDQDVIRQSLTLALLEKYQLVAKTSDATVCVIGDGFASMTALLLANKLAKRVVLVNLSKTLLVDIWFLKLWLGEEAFKSKVSIVTDKIAANDLLIKPSGHDGGSGSVIAIEAKNHRLIRELPIDIVINIASMQEMNPATISEYFDDFRAISAKRKVMFYCCNREEKVLPDGVVTKLDEYPWSAGDKVLLDELCPWHQRYYSRKPPFYHSYDGPIRHRLVELG